MYFCSHLKEWTLGGYTTLGSPENLAIETDVKVLGTFLAPTSLLTSLRITYAFSGFGQCKFEIRSFLGKKSSVKY